MMWRPVSATHGGHSGGEPPLRVIDQLGLPSGVGRFRRLPVGVGKLSARLIHSSLCGALLGGLSLIAVQARLLIATLIEALRFTCVQSRAVGVSALRRRRRERRRTATILVGPLLSVARLIGSGLLQASLIGGV